MTSNVPTSSTQKNRSAGRAGKRDCAIKCWTFTLNNPTSGESESIKRSITTKEVRFGIIGSEVGDSGTPHLQGFIRLWKPLRMAGVKKLISPRAHLEKARGTDKQNKAYCSKEGKVFLEVGECDSGATPGNIQDQLSGRIREIIKLRSSGNRPDQILEDERFAGTYARYTKSIEMAIGTKNQAKMAERIKAGYQGIIWNRWQYHLVRYVENEPSKRKIKWYVDLEGNKGKTFMSIFLVVRHGAFRCENGRSQDLIHAYKGERIVVFDFSRSQEEHINYCVIESMKNGIMFSPKYESGMKMFPPPHVIVFANFPPDKLKLSEDRWNIYEMDENDMLPTQAAVVKEEEEEAIIITDSEDEY